MDAGDYAAVISGFTMFLILFVLIVCYLCCGFFAIKTLIKQPKQRTMGSIFYVVCSVLPIVGIISFIYDIGSSSEIFWDIFYDVGLCFADLELENIFCLIFLLFLGVFCITVAIWFVYVLAAKKEYENAVKFMFYVSMLCVLFAFGWLLVWWYAPVHYMAPPDIPSFGE